MIFQNPACAGSRHDFFRIGNELENLESIVTKIPIAAKVPVTESEEMPDLMSDHIWGNLRGTECHVSRTACVEVAPVVRTAPSAGKRFT